MTYDELKQAQAAGAHIYGIGDDGKLHRIENPGWSCPPDRYLALLPFDSDLVRDAALTEQLAGALRFILAFYEPGQTYLDTNAWTQAEANARRAMAKYNAIHAQAGGSES